MKDKNCELTIEKIVNYIKGLEYGTTIEFQELQQFTSFNLNDIIEFERFKINIMPKVKNILLKYGLVLKSVKYIGYYILKPNQISSYCYRNYILNSFKRLNKSKKILNNFDKRELNTIEKTEATLTYDLNDELIQNFITISNEKKYKEINKNEIL